MTRSTFFKTLAGLACIPKVKATTEMSSTLSYADFRRRIKKRFLDGPVTWRLSPEQVRKLALLDCELMRRLDEAWDKEPRPKPIDDYQI